MPAPVGPTIATLLPGFITKLKFFKITLFPNENFILLTDDNLPLNYEQALKNIGNVKPKMLPVTFYSKELKVYYGLYSRHGFFHGVNLPGPEINIRQIRHNF